MPDAKIYNVGWICAITTEYVAAQSFLDEKHNRPDHVSTNDSNIYTLGRIGKHNVVIGVMPDGEYGIAAAAGVAKGMLTSFPNVRIGLMVGIGGGAPSPKNDIRLGDIVVSTPRDGHGGVFQYDFGKTIQGQTFQTLGFLNQPPEPLRAAIADIRAEYELDGHQLEEAITGVFDQRPRLRRKYQRPGEDSDKLFQKEVVHPKTEGASCESCYDGPSSLVERHKRTDEEDNPAIHYGTIASANQLMKDALVRDRLAEERNVLCFEMEAAGLMNRFPCIVIRGICDYSDSHKNKEWQGYAAMAAAAYAKDLLCRIPPNKVEAERQISAVLESLTKDVEDIRMTTVDTEEEVQNIHTTLRHTDHMMILGRLPIAEGASFDSSAEEHSPTCLRDTRVDLLRHIHEWALDPNAKPIFWLNGMAGTGKSTISRTISRSFSESGHLGGSFFFKRGELDRGSLSKFFTTLASQLAKREPAIAPHIKATIDADPHIAGKAVRDQFSELVMRPLSSVVPGTWRLDTLVVVVDALDECDQDEDVKLLINLFSSTTDLRFPKLKTLITSRPELPLRLGFNAVKGTYQDLVLHEISSGIIEHDISAFFDYELAKIKIEYNSSVPEDRRLPLDWPGEANVQLLVKKAIPLFIFAATVCRFLSDRRFGDPNAQLNEVLQFQRRGQMSQLSATYLPILNRLIDGIENRQRDHLMERFRHIVGSIVVLGNPLPISALGRLLNIQKETVHTQMDLLHSVLSIPSSEQSPVRMLHLSFRDFLVDPKERGNHPFWVDEKQAHDQLAMHCLTIMNESLETDICKLRQPGTDRGSISPQKIGSHILPEVQYACLYWVHHIQQADICVDDNRLVYDFLLYHFLHWIEVLSLISKASESLTIIKDLQAVSKPERNRMLVDFLQDAQRFILTNISTIDSTPLQIYSSVLAFTPRNSAVRKAFFQDHQIPKWISLAPEPEDNWDQCQQILEGHTDVVTSVAFSHDSTVVASASFDKTIRLWRVDDGACIQELKGHTKSVTSVAFSHDSTVVASASYDKTIRLWRVDDDACIQELKGYSDSVMSVAFSHDSTVVASASVDKTIRLWRVDDGVCIQEVTGIYSSHLQFDPQNSCLLTDAGAISLKSPILLPGSTNMSFTHCLSGIGMSEDRCWIMWKEKRLLWLPAPFRPQCLTVSGSSVILGCNSGRVIFMRFVDLWLLD
ncbi:hypothetical protein AUP68_10427 [Ilyonectria robusta]